MSSHIRRLRRVITALNNAEQSIAMIDGPPAETLEWDNGGGLYEIWTDVGGPLSRVDPVDRGSGDVKLCPPEGGAKIRWFTVGPDDPEATQKEAEQNASEVFSRMGALDCRGDTSRHSSMHTTPTIDIIVLVKGRIRLILDDDERVLEVGDVVVQRGTNHGWVVEGDEPALLVAVLIDREFE